MDKKTVDYQHYIDRIYQKRDSGEIILECGVGSGLTAAAAIQGGADILATYHTAACRIDGVPSLLSYLPYDNCNETVFRMLPPVLAHCRDIPLLVGIGAHDPRQPLDALLDRVVASGASGVVNEPFIGMYDGVFRQRLEQAGISVECEIELVRKASERGLLSLAWCFGPDDAYRMAAAGATLIGALCKPDPAHALSVDSLTAYVKGIISAVRKAGSEAPVLIHGSPVNEFAVAAEVIRRSGADGYATGSSGERQPVMDGICNVLGKYKSIVKGT